MIEGESRKKMLRIMNLYRPIFINIGKIESVSTFKEINRKKRICICAVSLLHQHELKKKQNTKFDKKNVSPNDFKSIE